MKILKRKPSANQCIACIEANISTRTYCIRLGEYVDDVVYCPYFEARPAVELQTAT